MDGANGTSSFSGGGSGGTVLLTVGSLKGHGRLSCDGGQGKGGGGSGGRLRLWLGDRYVIHITAGNKSAKQIVVLMYSTILIIRSCTVGHPVWL